MTRSRLASVGWRGVMSALCLTVVLGACIVEDGSQDTGQTPATNSPQPDPEESGVEFSTWAEDSFEENAYFEVVEIFEAETGIPVVLDLTVNEIPLENLGQ